MDAKLCRVPAVTDETKVMRSDPLPMWVGVVVMAKVIEFYVPDRFRKTGPWVPPGQRGKVIEFPPPQKKTA